MSAASSGLALPFQGQGQQPGPITVEDLKAMETIAGLEFTDAERTAVLNQVNGARRAFESMRQTPLDNGVAPPTPFVPAPRIAPASGVSIDSTATIPELPATEEDIAFAGVAKLGALLRGKRISPVELANIALKRLERYDPKLLCVVNLTPELALKQAAQAEDELMAGRVRGPLHGIPYGIKDLFATAGAPTTWGAEPYKSQVLEFDAYVVERLAAAGAVLCAKLSMGALAQGDVWFKGRTNNPWNINQGSSGSSAGSACAVAAGLVPFAIGTETLGSIVSPSHQCRVTGLRPTFGRISRYGAMTLSWSMDKVGPICRSAEDCAIVLSALVGRDARDAATVERPYHWPADVDLSSLRIGYLVAANADLADTSALEREDFLQTLVKLGAKPKPIKFDPQPAYLSVILNAECAAAFDDFTRGDAIDSLKNSNWPNTFRAGRFIPAVEYIQAMRRRTQLIERFQRAMDEVDLFIANERGGYTLFHTNLSGHPQVLIPYGTNANGAQRSVSFVGQWFDEARLLAVAQKYQEAAGFLSLRPDMSTLA